MELQQRVEKAFTDALDLPADVDWATLEYRQYETWSSLGHMTLVAALEEEFDAMMEADDILEMSSFNKAVEIMRKYDA
ncbi:MAG: acyl carrier protein [Azospirillaceae bacterium]|nr:acyl carrier protein [Azospirillaceae bacterium]